MNFNSPLSSSKANDLIGLLELPHSSHVLDVGCGTGEFLTRVVEQYLCNAVGVDIAESSIATARETALERVPKANIEFRQIDVRKLDVKPASFDCVLCIGATHAFALNKAAYPEALKGLLHFVKPGGLVLVGESYWMREPAIEYLKFIGDPVGTYRTHMENVELARELGLLPLYAISSTLEEWDDFEWRHNFQKERAFAAGSKNEEAQKAIEFSRQWRRAYLKWGRGTMGFAYYLFQKS